MLNKKRADYFFLMLDVVAILFMISFISIGHVEAAVEIGKFGKVEGKVDVLKDGELPAIPAKAGDKVFTKNVIRTKSNSKAEILFSDGNILKIEQRSRVDISEYVSEDGKGKRIIKLPRGKVEATVLPAHAKLIEQSPKTDSFEIHTPNAVAGVRGTQYRVLHIGNVTWVFVFEGSVDVYNPLFPDTVQVVLAGFMIMIPANGPAEPPRPLDPALLGLDLNSLPPGTGSTQTDTVVVEPVALDNTPPYIPPPADNPPPPPPPDTTVSFVGIVDSYLSDSEVSAFSYYAVPWPEWGGLYGTGDILGSFSGSTASWSDPAPFTASGTYFNDEPRATLFGTPFAGSATDGTAFIGGIGGRIPNNQIEGGLLGLYIKPDNTAGILFSKDMTGTHGSGDTGTWQTSGTLNAVDMGTTTYSPADLSWNGSAIGVGEWWNGSVENLWDDNQSGTAYLKNIRISDQGWGLLWGDMGNTYTYSATPPSDWEMEVSFNEYESGEGPLASTAQIEVKGTEWANNKLSGKFLGYAASITDQPTPTGVITAIMVGETIGTFDPNASTWQAINTGYIIETNKFLSMVQTTAGRASLQKLNIPSVEIGRVDLSGAILSDGPLTGTDYVSVLMNNVIFFAPSTGQKPGIWATNDFTGSSYDFSNGSELNASTIISPENVIALSDGNTIEADFQFMQWQGGRWIAKVSNGAGDLSDGDGSYTGPVNFKGAAAGTMTGTTAGTLSGTAAGTVK